jgi:putative ABC transport system substrate-binding protein
MTLMTSEILGKQLQLLHEMVPGVTTFGYLSPLSPDDQVEDLTNNIVAASLALGAELVVVEARSRSDIETAFATLVQRGTGALVIPPYLVFGNSDRVLELVAWHRIPTICSDVSWVRRGGLMSYSANRAGVNKVTVDYIVRILKGAKPANLPVQQPTAFDLAINVTTAKRHGLAVPQTLLVLATELID